MGAQREQQRDERKSDDSAALKEVINRLQLGAEDLARRFARGLPAQVPTYAPVPASSLEASALSNVRRVIAGLQQGHAPTSAEINETDVARERAEQGVPIEDVLHAYRLCLRVIRDAFLEHAEVVGMRTAQVAHSVQLLWDVTDQVTVTLAIAHREMAIERASHDEQQRLDFLRSILYGASSTAALHGTSAAYGLATDQPYYAVRGRPRAGTSLVELGRALAAGGALPDKVPLIGILDGDVAGLVATIPKIDQLHATVGIGAQAPLESAEQSFRTASRVLDVAQRFDIEGCFQLGDLSWKIAVASEPELGALLIKKYLEPLDRHGDFGELVENSVRALLSTEEGIGATAQRLFIHVNTLRYRVRRFEALTGVSLSSPAHVVEIQWALQARLLDRADREPRLPRSR